MKVGLLTPSGWGNLGDAAIQDATIQAIRRRRPGAVLHGFTLNPHDTQQRHGIEADPLSGFSIAPGYRVQLNGARPELSLEAANVGADSLATGLVEPSDSAPSSRDSRSGDSSPSSKVKPVPSPKRILQTADEWLYRALCDGRYLRRTRSQLSDFDLILASGGGQVDDEWGGAWGHPWTLAKWSGLARSASVPFRMLSVGLCHLDTLASRLFARMALRQSDYVSFRDAGSRRRALEMGLLEQAEVVPDLAFGHTALDPSDWVEGDPNAVAVGPMVWKDPQRWSHRDGVAHEDYLVRLGELIQRLLGAGRRVVLLPSDASDAATVATLRARFANVGTGVLETPTIESVLELFAELHKVGSVVASRLHLAIFAAALGKPVLTVSYDTKVDALAEDLELWDFRCDIRSAKASEMEHKLQRMEAHREALRNDLRLKMHGYRRRLDHQWDEVLR